MFFKKKDEDGAVEETPENTIVESADNSQPKDANSEAVRHAVEAKFKAAAFAEIVSVLMRSPIHKKMSLNDLEWFVVPPYLSKQYSIAKARNKDSDMPAAPVGVALWASVSDEIDQRLSNDLDQPILLQPAEWKSGDNLWLIDVVASKTVGSALVEELKRNTFKGKSFKMRVAGEDGSRSIQIVEAAV